MDSLNRFTFFLLRVVSGFMFFQGGANKILGWFPAGHPKPEVMDQMWIGGMLELVGGLLILVGLFTRPTAFILSGMMAVAYWQFHFGPNGGWPNQNGGVAAVLYCFIFLYMAAHGAGAWSLDAKMKAKKSRGG